MQPSGLVRAVLTELCPLTLCEFTHQLHYQPPKEVCECSWRFTGNALVAFFGSQYHISLVDTGGGGHIERQFSVYINLHVRPKTSTKGRRTHSKKKKAKQTNVFFEGEPKNIRGLVWRGGLRLGAGMWGPPFQGLYKEVGGSGSEVCFPCFEF